MKTIISLYIQQIEEGNYHVFLNIKIGRKSAYMLLDTGASKTVFDRKNILKFVDKKLVKKDDSKSVGLGSSDVPTRISTLKNMHFGKLKIPEFEVAVLDLSHVNQTYNMLRMPQIDGVLGSDFFYKYGAVIDYRKRMMILPD